MYVIFTTFTSRHIARNWFIVPDSVFPLFLLNKICNLMIIFKLVIDVVVLHTATGYEVTKE